MPKKLFAGAVAPTVPTAQPALLQDTLRQKKLSDDAATLLSRAARLSSPMLAARGQIVSFGPMERDTYAGDRPCRIVALFACALQEMSTLTQRKGVVTCTVLADAVVFRGDNPIMIPDAALAMDWMMLDRARALAVVPQLGWDQGRGPVLTLVLPDRMSGNCNPAQDAAAASVRSG